MGLLDLNHFTIRVRPEALDETARFYTEVLGLALGYRPPFGFPGHWLYCGESAVVHLVGTGEEPAGEAAPSTGRLDHIAFRATGIAEMRRRLKRHGIAHQERTVPDVGLKQVFVRDPNGILIELNYPAGDEVGERTVETAAASEGAR